MITLERTAGNAYTKDPDYAAFTGQLVRTISTTYYDPKLNAWIKRTCEYIDVGRPDTVAPVDCGALIETVEDGLFEDDEKSPLLAAWQATRQRKVERDAQRVINLKAAFTDHGPMSMIAIAEYMDVGPNKLRELARANPDIFVYLGGDGKAWGLHGQQVTERTRTTKLQAALRDALLEHGPLSTPKLGAIVNRTSDAIAQPLRLRNDIFAVVGSAAGYMREDGGYTPVSNIWGLIGVHDKETA